MIYFFHLIILSPNGRLYFSICFRIRRSDEIAIFQHCVSIGLAGLSFCGCNAMWAFHLWTAWCAFFSCKTKFLQKSVRIISSKSCLVGHQASKSLVDRCSLPGRPAESCAASGCLGGIPHMSTSPGLAGIFCSHHLSIVCTCSFLASQRTSQAGMAGNLGMSQTVQLGKVVVQQRMVERLGSALAISLPCCMRCIGKLRLQD